MILGRVDAFALRAAAVDVLRRCERGGIVGVTPQQGPCRQESGRHSGQESGRHWRWDVPVLAMGLIRFDVPRAIRELRSLLDAQWSTGMLPHAVFLDDGPAFEPGADVWGADKAVASPAHVRTSGICPTPTHAIAVRAILDRGRATGGQDLVAAEDFAAESFDALLAWYRWLRDVRDPDSVGLLEIHHPWESDLAGSTRWDGPLSRTGPTPDASRAERLGWLVDQMRAVGYDDEAMRECAEFRVHDVLVSAVFAANCDVLAEIGEEVGRSSAAGELRATAARFRRGVAGSVDPENGLARDYDVRAQVWLPATTVAGFAPLIAGGERDLLAGQRALLLGDRWMGHPVLRHPLPPTVSPADAGFRRRAPGHGPVWPPVVALLSWAAARDSEWGLRAVLREASLELLVDHTFSEFYEPVTGEPIGATDHAWTAAAALELLG